MTKKFWLDKNLNNYINDNPPSQVSLKTVESTYIAELKKEFQTQILKF